MPRERVYGAEMGRVAWCYLFFLVEPDGVPALLLIRHADGDAGPPVLQPGPGVLLQAAQGAKPSLSPSSSASVAANASPPSKPKADASPLPAGIAAGTRAQLTCPRPAPPCARG